MIDKRAGQWTLSDLQDAVAGEFTESIVLELKRDLPLADGATGWRTRQKIHASERDGLAKEIVAFANAYGGTILIGVEETSDAPKRAASLAQPLPMVHELVDRLRSSMAAHIDPPIASLEIAAIAAETSDAGYVVITVPSSLAKPHGLGRPPLTYVRRDDKSEPATMRDQQNMFWESRTDRERIAEEIKRKAAQLEELGPQGDINFQFTAVSAHPMSMPGLARAMKAHEVIWHPGQYQVWRVADAAEFPANSHSWRPTASGVEFRETKTDTRQVANIWEIDELGVISVTAANNLRQDQYSSSKVFFPGWYSKTAGAVLALSEIVSQWAGYSGGWVFSAKFEGADGIYPKIDDHFSAHPKVAFGAGISLRPIAVGRGLPKEDLAEVADRIWSAFGIVRPADDSSLQFGVDQTRQFLPPRKGP